MRSKGKGAIELRAGILRGMHAEAAVFTNSAGFSAFPEAALGDVPGGLVRKGHWLERDLNRALDAADRAGIDDYRVEIEPDGTIAIVVEHEHRGRPRKARPLSRSPLIAG